MGSVTFSRKKELEKTTQLKNLDTYYLLLTGFPTCM